MTTPRSIGVVVSRFPKFTETFVANEILALESLGHRVEIYPLLPVQPPPHQPRAVPLLERARFGPLLSPAVAAALYRALRSSPGALASIVTTLVRETWRRPSFLARDLVLVPRIVVIAESMTLAGVEHVHAHFATHGGFAAWAIGRLTGIPYSFVGHGSDIHRHQAMLATKAAEAAFVALVSEFNRDVVADHCGPGSPARLEVVRFGVVLEDFEFRSRASVPERPALVCVGTLHEVKGQRHAIRALAELREAGIDATLTLIGDGPDRDELVDLAESEDVADATTFCGAIASDEVLRELGRHDVMLIPSVASSDGRKEGIPTVAMEAMALGLPVVASDLAGIPEIVRPGRTGMLSVPGDPSSIAECVRALIDDPGAVQSMTVGARELIESDYDIAVCGERMSTLIEQSHELTARGSNS